MLRNADYIEKLIPKSSDDFEKKAQVGIDITVKSIKEMTVDFVNFPTVFSDEILQKNILPEYRDIPPVVAPEVENNSLQGYWQLEPGTYSIEFDQGIELGENDTAFIIHRSSLGRMGAQIYSGVFDPGFKTSTMGAILRVSIPMIIYTHARVAQVIVFENQKVSELYNGQWQGEKDVK
jgi:deoxycytidine triphosphate deaminase